MNTDKNKTDPTWEKDGANWVYAVSQRLRDLEARVKFSEAELYRLDEWIEKEGPGAPLPPNAVDAIILIAEMRGRQFVEEQAAAEDQRKCAAHWFEKYKERQEYINIYVPALEAKVECDRLIKDKMRETLAKCANPMRDDPLAMSPESIVAHVEDLRALQRDALRSYHRFRKAEIDKDDAFAYIHALWINGQLPSPMTDSLRARVQKWDEPDSSAERIVDALSEKAAELGITFEEAAKRIADNA